MNFDLSDETKDLRGEVQRFLTERAPLSVARAAADASDHYDRSLWQQVVELGWPGVAVPESLGGVGMSYEAMCIIAEQVGRVLAPIPIVSSFAAIEALSLAGDEEQKQRWLPGLASGERIGAIACAEGPGNPDARLIEACVVDGRLTGTKWPVADGMIADILIIVARAEVGIGLHVVEADGHGVMRTELETLDFGRGHARIRFEGAVAERLAGNDGSGWSLVERLLDRVAMIAAFEQLGGATACLDMAVEHAKQRIAFGRPIGSFQAVKHKLADIYIATELCRSNAYYAAWSLDNRRDEAVAAASARVAAIDAYELASRENIHVHGGQGFSWELDCHLFFRRSRMLASMLGTASYWKNRLIAHSDPDSGRKTGQDGL